MWHSAQSLSFDVWTQPLEHWENPETKSRCNGLLEVSGIKDCLVKVKARKAVEEEVLRFHTVDYMDMVRKMSEGDGGDAGDDARMSKGAYDIALYAVGGVLAAVEGILTDEEDDNHIENAYCLVRPPGHHAVSNMGMGFCIFNNVALGVMHARELWKNRPPLDGCGEGRPMKVAVVDYDVHHGNGSQQAFWDDPDTLFISVHQDSNYPLNVGCIDEVGGASAQKDGHNTTINIPLPPGSGKGAYAYAFDTVIIPALHRFSPDMIFVSSGFDASYADPLGAMMLSAEDYRAMTEKLLAVADTLCGGRILFSHEGGYSKDYVPFCCLAVVEELCGGTSAVLSSYDDVYSWGYQELQFQQATLVDAVAVMAGLPPGSVFSSVAPDKGANSNHESAACNVDNYDVTLQTNDLKVAAAVKVLLDGMSNDSLCKSEGEGKSPGSLTSRKRAILSHVLKDYEMPRKKN